MKSKELIRLLLEADPTGEVEVSVGNADIFYVGREPAFYDGSLQVLTRDESKKPYYNITGAKYVRSGSKVVIHTLSITDLLWDDPDLPVDYSQLSGWSLDSCKAANDKTSQAGRDVELKVEMDAFYAWVKKQAAQIYDGEGAEDCRHAANGFYERNLSPKDPVKDLPPTKDKNGTWHPSWHERRKAMWDDTLEVQWEGEWVIRKKEVEGQKTEV